MLGDQFRVLEVIEELLRGLEVGHLVRAQIDRMEIVGIAPCGPELPVAFGKCGGKRVEDRHVRLAVEDFDDISQAQDLSQRMPSQPVELERIEGVRNVDEAALSLDALAGLDRAQAALDFLIQEQTGDLPTAGADLLADDQSKLGSGCFQCQRPGDGVVIRDSQHVNPMLAAEAGYILQPGFGAGGVDRMNVQGHAYPGTIGFRHNTPYFRRIQYSNLLESPTH